MKNLKKIIIIFLTLLLTGSSLKAQKQEPSFTDRLLLDLSGNVLIPQALPAGIGGGIGVGLAARDFNIFFRPQVLIAEPGGNQRIMLLPTVLFEVKIPILSNFVVLQPYVSAGGISTKIKRADGTLSSNNVALYAEVGVGAEIILSHELSLVPRIGVASALVYDLPDSNNLSGLTTSIAFRYVFGRSKVLDF